jgi:hypothetical protein
MRPLSLSIAVSAFAALLVSQPVWAEDPTFFNELKPMFDICGDGS